MVARADSVVVGCGLMFGTLFGALFLFPFGFVLSQAGYHTIQRGDFRFTSREGVVRIYSASTDPGVFWSTAIGESAGGVLLLFLAAALFGTFIYAVLRTWRAWHKTI